MNEHKGASSIIRLTDDEFRQLGEFIHGEYGIKMPPSKKTMLEARLQKRLRALGMTSFPVYIKYLFSAAGTQQELVEMVNVVTTNKTDFFREPAHFDILTGTVLPELERTVGAGFRKPLALWSAGCSSGEEPYSLAMVLDQYAEKHRDFRFFILATDISTKVLEAARLGIYAEHKVEPVPDELKRRYLLRSKDRESQQTRVVPELRSLVKFRRLNFMHDDFGLREPMHIIFCRNVVIYFDRPTQEVLLNRLCNHLMPGGFLFTGHSETLSGLNVPLGQVATTVYRKKV